MSAEITPDSYETFRPSQMGRVMKRRMASPAIETATSSAHTAATGKDCEAHSGGEVIEGDEREGEESPEDEGVRYTGQRAFADDLALAEHLPDEVANAWEDGSQGEAEVFAGGEDVAQDGREAKQEERGGRGDEGDEKEDFGG
jgi:hypothetical protein